MNRTIASSLHFGIVAAAVAAAAVLTAGKSYAEDITIDTTPVVLSASRAAVQAAALNAPATDEWTLQHNQVPHLESGLTTAQVKARFVADRDEVMALNAEDSGSMYFMKKHRSSTSAMGASAH